MKELLRKNGYKITPARLSVLDILHKVELPLTVEDICKELKKVNKNINETTIYRTLTLLEDGKFIKKIDLRKNSAYFELANRHHHHMVCLKCETIEDFKSQEIEKALSRIAQGSSKFNSISDHSLELFGVCKKCL